MNEIILEATVKLDVVNLGDCHECFKIGFWEPARGFGGEKCITKRTKIEFPV
jgi:hypothetical protein